MDVFIECLREIVQAEMHLFIHPDAEDTVNLHKAARETLLVQRKRLGYLWHGLKPWERINAQVMARVSLGVILTGWNPP